MFCVLIHLESKFPHSLFKMLPVESTNIKIYRFLILSSASIPNRPYIYMSNICVTNYTHTHLSKKKEKKRKKKGKK